MLGSQNQEAKGCLADEVVLSYLEGTLSAGERQVVEAHFLNCSSCREALALYIRVSQPDISVEEQAQLEQIDLHRLAEQAKQLHRTERRRRHVMPDSMRRGVFVPWRLAACVAACVGAVALVWYLFIHQTNVEQGMAALRRAYAQERPLEARLTGGFPYAPYETRRGENESGIDKTSLMLARAILAEAALHERTPEAHHALGLVYLAEHKYDEALEQLESALIKDPDDPRLHSDLGVAYLQKGEYWQKSERNQSMADFARALEHFTKAWEKDSTLLEALFNRALCYQKMYLFSKAEADWKQYLELDATSPWAEEAKRNWELIKKKQQAVSQTQEESSWALNTFLSLAWDAMEFSDYEKSLSLYQQACQVIYQYGWKPSSISQFYSIAAAALSRMEIYQAAAACQQEAAQFALQSSQPQLTSIAQANLGLLYGRLGQFSSAMSMIQSALTHANRIQDEVTRNGAKAYALFAQGQLQIRQDQSAEALKAFDQAWQIFTAQGNQYFAAQVRHAKVKPLLGSGQLDAAETELRASLDFIERRRQTIGDQDQRIGFYTQGRDIYDTMIWFDSAVKHNPAAAFDVAEASRARSLLDVMHMAEKLRLAPERLGLVVSSNSEPLRLAEIRSALPAQMKLVQYAVTPDRLIISMVSSDSFRAAESRISEGELTRLVKEFRRAIERKSKPEIVTRVAGRLYDVLIRPIERHLVSNQQICFIPDKSLYYVPFAALWDSQSRMYLIERYALLNSPSATVFVRCWQTAQAKGNQQPAPMLSVGNPQFNRAAFPQLMDLPSAELEAVRCREYYPGARVLTAEAATEPAVVRAMGSAETINLAVHCLVDEYTPMLSKLILTPSGATSPPGPADGVAPVDPEDGVLHAYELYQCSFPRTRLVVLSACQSAVGRYYYGEGVIGMERPFIARGVPAVIASLWTVESRATAQFMERFHQERQINKRSVSQALQAAQLWLLKDSTMAYSHPYYWSSFILNGADLG